jgi:hypothetical protein
MPTPFARSPRAPTPTAALLSLAVAAVAVLAPLAAGCVPTSKNPVGDPSKAAFDRDLAGIWRFEPKKDARPDEGPHYVAFVPRGEREVEVVMFDLRGGEKGVDLSYFRGLTTRVGERRFLSIAPVMMDGDVKDAAKAAEEERPLFLLCYELPSPGRARMGLAKLPPLAAAIEGGKLQGKSEKGQIPSVALSDTSDALAAHFSQGKVEDHFEMDIALVRVEAGPAPAAPAGEAK